MTYPPHSVGATILKQPTQRAKLNKKLYTNFDIYSLSELFFDLECQRKISSLILTEGN